MGWVKGQPLRFINGHSRRKPRTWTVDVNGCWLWDGPITDYGYGMFYAGHTHVSAHRHVYEEHRGAIPDGLVLDHLCRVRRCVNPDHLEPVTDVENVMRGIGFAPRNAAKTHCPQGHPLLGDNLYVAPSGWRQCRTCRREQDRARRQRRAARVA